VQREDLNSMEEAKAYQQLNKDFELTHIQIAKIVGKDRATVSNLIRLLNLDDEIQQLILDKILTTGHARAILQIDKSLHHKFAEFIIEKKLSVRKTEQAAKQIKKIGYIAKQKQVEKIDFSDYEKQLSNYLKIKTSITGKKSNGKISLYYDSEEKFLKLFYILKGKND